MPAAEWKTIAAELRKDRQKRVRRMAARARAILGVPVRPEIGALTRLIRTGVLRAQDVARNATEAADLGRDFVPRPASSPTDAMPSTAEKKRVVAARAAAGEELWHPEDRTE